MAFPKPTDSGEWASGPDADIQDPLPGQRALGWVAGEAPRAGTFNKLFNTLYQWAQYVSTYEDTLRAMPLTVTALWTYSAGVSITAGGLSVDGGLILSGGANVAGTLNITSGGANVTGPVAVTGTLGATGNATVGGTLGVTGNTTVGGTLGVTGAATVGSLNAGSGAISGGAVSGNTMTAAGAATAATFQYGTATAQAPAYLDASCMCPLGVNSNTGTGRALSTQLGLSSWNSSTTESYVVRGKMSIPAGATITSLQIEALTPSAAPSPSSIAVTAYMRVSDGSTAPMTTTAIATAVSVSVPQGSTANFYSVTLTGGPYVTPLNGYVVVEVALPQTPVVGDARLYSVRMGYSLTILRPVV